MKIQKASAVPFSLSNHSWASREWLKLDNGADIVREIKGGALIRIPGPAIPVLRREQQPNTASSPAEVFWEAHYLIELLQHFAESGSAEAAHSLARLTYAATIALDKIAKQKPQLLRSLARQCHVWPVTKKKREALSDAEKKLFADIELGEDSIIELNAQSAKWKNDDAGKIAGHLLNYMHRARSGAGFFNYGKLGKALRRLPEFDKDSAKDWWLAAKMIFGWSYPEPQKIEELNLLVTAERDRKSPGRMRFAIFRILKARFVSLARNARYDRKPS